MILITNACNMFASVVKNKTIHVSESDAPVRHIFTASPNVVHVFDLSDFTVLFNL